MNGRNVMEICSEIRIKRWEMIEFAQLHGMCHDQTLHISEQLDKLINEYLILQHHSHSEMKVKKEDMVVIVQKPFYNDCSL